MELAEAGRAEHGAGAVITGMGICPGHRPLRHVGSGCRQRPVAGAQPACSARGWSRTTLWTRTSNARARVSYEARDSKPQGGPSLEMATSIFSASVKRSSAAVGPVGGQGHAEPVVGGVAVPAGWLYDQ